MTPAGPGGDRVWSITGADAGRVAGATFHGVENTAPGSGDNVFRFANGTGVRARGDGGSGRNTLDDSAYTTPVPVNLRLGEATGRGRGTLLRTGQQAAGGYRQGTRRASPVPRAP